MLSISKLLIKTGHNIFLNIFAVLGVSIGWSLFIFPAVFLLPLPGAIFVLVLTLVPATTAVYAVMNRILNGEKRRRFEFFRSFLYYYKRSFLTGIVLILAVLIPVSEWWYYLNMNNGYTIFLFAVFQTYLCATFLASQVYAIPLLVMEDLKVFQAMNRSIKLFLAHPWYSIGLFVQIVSVTVLLSLSIVGFFLLYIGMLSIFVLHATQNLKLDSKKKLKVKPNLVENSA
ncbi:DUF624 domain-containing protein [Paenibacillus sp. J2TS4]|uniref:DUF624 domain-containing protein n=1 Tax=Paenibacillus sp. J2TS4 TaxID=2807194 RepID=UPI001B22FB17|nr:DUF624 domain-containing protein [Paenibacillus sp. J2TS4]GIP31141.1 hypothetical protein J2TS4_03510 [Paenibacillus sp. J2TS4]